MEEGKDTSITVASMYKGTVNAGTEEVSQEDLNTPTLRIIQKLSEVDIDNPHIGWFYRNDLKEEFETVDINLIYVTTVLSDNYNKTAKEKVKVYFGFYKDSKEPFKMFVRGWSMAGHRNFQSEVGMWKAKLHVPMFALMVRLSTVDQEGTMKDNGKAYNTKKLVFTILKDDNKQPIVEMNPDRISFLFEAVQRFKESALGVEEETQSVHDRAQNDNPDNQPTKIEAGEPAQETDIGKATDDVADDIPF